MKKANRHGLQKLNDVRKHVDRTDAIIVTVLAERMSLVEDIARIKKRYNFQIFDEKRDGTILKNFLKHSKRYGLNPSFAEEVFLSVMNEAKRVQRKIVKGH